MRAAGGVVWRAGGGTGGLEVLLVHRPRYDDWTFPKGKAEAGERDEDCALREVEEETSLRCALGEELSSVRYTDRFGRPKQVRYWAMEPVVHGDWAPNDEVDSLRWVSVEDGRELLTYPHDRPVVDRFMDRHRRVG